MTLGRSLDDAFLDIVSDWVKLTTSSAEKAVQTILQSSGQYLTGDHKNALSDFYTLYFADADLDNSKQSINRDVDELFDVIQAKIASEGDAADLSGIEERAEAKQARLSLSGVQKQLETIIQMEAGIKQKLLPVLSSMQFEDALRQRLTRMEQAWRQILAEDPKDDASFQDVSEKIAKSLGSSAERQAFFPSVLKKSPPKEMIDELTFFDTLS